MINGKSVLGENEPAVGAAQFASPSELRTRVREEYEAGRRLTAMGRHREAVPHFNEAIRLDPDYADAYYRLGLTYVHLGDTRKARATRTKLAKIDVDRANLLAHLIN